MTSSLTWFGRLIPVLTLAAVIVGCASSGQSKPAAVAAAGPSPSASPSSRPEPPATSADSAGDAGTIGAELPGLVAGILAERRRSDFPELEQDDYGFTITERVRVDGDARGDYQRALELLRQDRFAEGVAVLESVVAEAPDATLPYIDLGMAYRLIGDLEQAEQTLRIADALSPDNPVVHNELGIVYRQTGRFAEARASYEQALGVFADFHYARRNLAVLCDLYLADLACALQHYQSYLDSVGGDAEVEIWVADLKNRLASQGDM